MNSERKISFSKEAAMSIETTAFDPVSGEPLPPTASHAARILSRFISGKPELSDKSLSTYTSIIRECMDNHSFTLDDWNAALGLESGNPLGNVVLRTLESRVSDNDAVLESSKTLEPSSGSNSVQRVEGCTNIPATWNRHCQRTW